MVRRLDILGVVRSGDVGPARLYGEVALAAGASRDRMRVIVLVQERDARRIVGAASRLLG